MRMRTCGNGRGNCYQETSKCLPKSFKLPLKLEKTQFCKTFCGMLNVKVRKDHIINCVWIFNLIVCIYHLFAINNHANTPRGD